MKMTIKEQIVHIMKFKWILVLEFACMLVIILSWNIINTNLPLWRYMLGGVGVLMLMCCAFIEGILVGKDRESWGF